MNQEKVWNTIAKDWSKFRVKTIEDVVKFFENKTGNVLDLGCGSGRNFVKNEKLKFYGVDFSEEMVKFAKKHAKIKDIKVELTKANTYNLPFDDDFFDSGIYIAALHCIPKSEDRKKSLKELLRVLKPNSEALISVWDYNQKKFNNKEKESFIPWKHNGKEYFRYYYLYNQEEIINLLKKVGFEIIKTRDKNNSNGFYSKKNIIIIVKKPKN